MSIFKSKKKTTPTANPVLALVREQAHQISVDNGTEDDPDSDFSSSWRSSAT